MHHAESGLNDEMTLMVYLLSGVTLFPRLRVRFEHSLRDPRIVNERKMSIHHMMTALSFRDTNPVV